MSGNDSRPLLWVLQPKSSLESRSMLPLTELVIKSYTAPWKITTSSPWNLQTNNHTSLNATFTCNTSDCDIREAVTVERSAYTSSWLTLLRCSGEYLPFHFMWNSAVHRQPDGSNSWVNQFGTLAIQGRNILLARLPIFSGVHSISNP